MSKTTTPIPHHPNSPKKLIEDKAIENVQLQADNGATALLSIAVSLKRIADAITPQQGGTTTFAFAAGQDFAAGIEQIAFSIGQQIHRGTMAG